MAILNLIIFFLLFRDLKINFRKMIDGIIKYFHSIISIIIGFAPAIVALLLFDHSILSKSDILKSIGGKLFWSGMIIMYSACFYSLYNISTKLIHPIFFKIYKVDSTPKEDDWRAVIA